MTYLKLTLSYKNAVLTDVYVNMDLVQRIVPTKESTHYYVGSCLSFGGDDDMYVLQTPEDILTKLELLQK